MSSVASSPEAPGFKQPLVRPCTRSLLGKHGLLDLDRNGQHMLPASRQLQAKTGHAAGQHQQWLSVYHESPVHDCAAKGVRHSVTEDGHAEQWQGPQGATQHGSSWAILGTDRCVRPKPGMSWDTTVAPSSSARRRSTKDQLKVFAPKPWYMARPQGAPPAAFAAPLGGAAAL